MSLQTQRAASAAVRIGALAPLSRPGWLEAGRQLLAGLELAAQDINVQGGIGGRRLEMLVHDTAGDPRRAEEAVEDLAGAGVAALVGEYHSVVARAVAARANAFGLPFLCSSAVLDALGDEPSGRIARIAPPQSRGWRLYAEFLLEAGHRHIAVAAQPSLYWATGTRILRDRMAAGGGRVVEIEVGSQAPSSVCDELARSGATVVLLLVGYPDPAMSLVQAVRADTRLAGITIGAPAGQPEFGEWLRMLGRDGAAIPFLRYLPDHLTPLGAKVEAALRDDQGAAPSFVAFEGYDTIVSVCAMLRPHGGGRSRSPEPWADVTAEGTRGRIRFSRPRRPDGVWEWEGAPLQVAARDPADPQRIVVLHAD